MTHTPTPWRTYYDDTDESHCGWFILPPGSNHPIARCAAVSPEEHRAKGNAAHIVHCVNSHAALVEALKLTLMNAKAPDAIDWSAVEERLERVLAQAEGGA